MAHEDKPLDDEVARAATSVKDVCLRTYGLGNGGVRFAITEGYEKHKVLAWIDLSHEQAIELCTEVIPRILGRTN